MPQDRARDSRRVPPAVDWQSPFPVGHPDRTEPVSREQQTANMRGPKKTEYRTEVDKTSREMSTKDTPIITKSDYQQKHGWVSAWPSGHPNHSSVVTAEEQATNSKIIKSAASAGKPNPFVKP
jgi:hypothetical protein